MALCIISAIVLGIMSIFSAKYRPLAKEAFKCAARSMTLRPCQAGYDKKLRAQITGTVAKKNKKLARFIYKNFTFLSWVFTLILFVSLWYTAVAIYNLVIYGTCDPQTGQCIFNTTKTTVESCSV